MEQSVTTHSANNFLIQTKILLKDTLNRAYYRLKRPKFKLKLQKSGFNYKKFSESHIFIARQSVYLKLLT
jgi:hypothetical protein